MNAPAAHPKQRSGFSGLLSVRPDHREFVGACAGRDGDGRRVSGRFGHGGAFGEGRGSSRCKPHGILGIAGAANGEVGRAGGGSTAGREHAVLHHPEDVPQSLSRHAQGDWGELCEEDRAANERALKEGLRLFSVYTDRNGTKYYIITEHDRSVTTILLPEDY
jgi:hypothetical protein